MLTQAQEIALIELANQAANKPIVAKNDWNVVGGPATDDLIEAAYELMFSVDNHEEFRVEQAILLIALTALERLAVVPFERA